MCPNPKKPAPAAATLPTTQALDELNLASGDMLAAGAPVGRLALNTRGGSGRKGTTSAAQKTSAVDPLGLIAGVASAAQSQQDASSGGDPLGFQGEGRKLGSKQNFYEAEV